MYQINTVLCLIKVNSNFVGWLRKLQSSASGLDQMMFCVMGVVVGVKFVSQIVVLGLLFSSLAYHSCTGKLTLEKHSVRLQQAVIQLNLQCTLLVFVS